MRRTFFIGVSERYDTSLKWLSSTIKIRMLVKAEKAARDVELSPLFERSNSSNLLANGANTLLGSTFSSFPSNLRLVKLW